LRIKKLSSEAGSVVHRIWWAKRRKGIESQAEPQFHPLLFHLVDVAAVAERLWQAVLERHLMEEFARKLGVTPAVAGKWLAFWAGLHDFGKASPAFQGKWRDARDRLEEVGLSCPPTRTPFPHGILTAKLLRELLPAQFPGFSDKLARRVGMALGGHHGVFPRSGELDEVTKTERGGKKWTEHQAAFLKEFAGLWKTAELPVPAAIDPGHPFFLVLAGLVSVADWIGSNEKYFPFASPALELRAYRERAFKQAEKALDELGWTGWQAPTGFLELIDLFPALKPHGLRPLQEATVRVGQKLTEPGLAILEAPMGEGKTEAAMYLADRWAAALGQKGCYFALPTMATSNQMFSRVKEFLQRRYAENLVNLQLLHGHASLAAEFMALRRLADHLLPLRNIEAEGNGTKGQPAAEVLAAEWFAHRKRGLLAPYGVGTIDQALLGVLKTRHYFVRLFGLSHKTVVVDEVHAYDAYMVKLLERLLEWLAGLGCSVILLSATLPRQRRAALLGAYVKGLGGPQTPEVTLAAPYPRLTWITPSASGTEHFQVSPQFARTLRLEWVTGHLQGKAQECSLGARLKEVLAEGGCAAVICNTVSRAQEVYASLKPFFPERDAGDSRPELELLHARFLFEGREARERRALVRFGKPDGRVDLGDDGMGKVRRPRRAVLVATQVIEQSLDLDFDLMVTEMAPVDLLLQRAGRLHRHVRPRPEALQEPQLWVMEPDSPMPVPAFGKGTEAVYNYHILLKSWLALKDRHTLAIPQDVEDLIESVYGEGPPPESLSPEVRQVWDTSGEELRRSREMEEDQARYAYILPPDYVADILEDHNPQLAEDDPAVHRSLQAFTRLGDPSVSLIFLYEVQGRTCLDPAGEHPVSLDEKFAGPTARALLLRSVAISRRGLTRWLIDHGEIPPRWLKHPLLCRYRLIRLDGENRWRGGGCELRLDPELGVVITPLGKEVA
jgi:CRISPR-associated endonuclease/helicase Cas3